MTEVLSVAGISLVSLGVLLILTKLMGSKQVSQMTMFDYVIGITIGSIAAELATELEQPIQPLVAMIVYGLVALGITIWTSKSLKARRMLSGKPIILLDKGVIYRENLKRAKLDLSEFLTYCRIEGYFDLNQIQTAVFEHNGKVSFLPKAMQRPATPADFSIQPQQELLQLPLVLDGHALPGNLKRMGKDETWLQRTLSRQGYHGAEEVLLALCDGSNQLTVFPMYPPKGPESAGIE
ncbi:DUF421 domain-containing protein [Oscillibacter sp. MSJ-2]|uniref:DUF421 domain-containing protein n=1 Tax=Dysosmobacter acutus TaxID=2841504 RepID=A0ABS6F9B4_9FIRM|nr:DUF421 domain-containing protein [Dysosmobacter acutus]MBU5626850.1 DUF421 domain-containing protein [Dysosmobacter acutus]